MNCLPRERDGLHVVRMDEGQLADEPLLLLALPADPWFLTCIICNPLINCLEAVSGY